MHVQYDMVYMFSLPPSPSPSLPLPIKELLPVVVSFTLGMPGPIDTNPPEIAQLNLTYNVQIHIKPVGETVCHA